MMDTGRQSWCFVMTFAAGAFMAAVILSGAVNACYGKDAGRMAAGPAMVIALVAVPALLFSMFRIKSIDDREFWRRIHDRDRPGADVTPVREPS